MRLSILLFARYREAAGRPVVEVDVPEGATLEDAWRRLQAAVPALAREGRPLLACDRVYVTLDHVVREGEEVAAFPPVSGG